MNALCKGEHGKSGHQYKAGEWVMEDSNCHTAIFSGRNVNINDKNKVQIGNQADRRK
jgi:hypothetical protein